MSGLSAPAYFDSAGSLATVADTPEVFSSAKGFLEAGELCFTLTPSGDLTYANGLPLDETGAVYFVDKASAVAPLASAAGLTYDANGAIVVTLAGAATAPLAANSGLLFDATGALVVTDVV